MYGASTRLFTILAVYLHFHPISALVLNSFEHFLLLFMMRGCFWHLSNPDGVKLQIGWNLFNSIQKSIRETHMHVNAQWELCGKNHGTLSLSLELYNFQWLLMSFNDFSWLFFGYSWLLIDISELSWHFNLHTTSCSFEEKIFTFTCHAGKNCSPGVRNFNPVPVQLVRKAPFLKLFIEFIQTSSIGIFMERVKILDIPYVVFLHGECCARNCFIQINFLFLVWMMFFKFLPRFIVPRLSRVFFINLCISRTIIWQNFFSFGNNSVCNKTS